MSLGLYFLTFLLTLIIELGVAYVLGYRSKKKLRIFLFVNLITHPLLSYFLWINLNLLIIQVNYLSLIALEIVVVILESLLLRLGLKDKYLNLLIASVCMNSVSFLFGLVIF